MRFLLLAIVPVIGLRAAGTDFKKYRGAWFEITYPSAFRILPSLQSSGMPDEFDSVFFESPDKKVRFYIFSPQWAGETPDIALNDLRETYQLDKKENQGGFQKVWYTIRPRQKGRTRSYVETTNDEQTIRWVIGIEYTDRKAYQEYLPLYNKFKASLRQFSD